MLLLKLRLIHYLHERALQLCLDTLVSILQTYSMSYNLAHLHISTKQCFSRSAINLELEGLSHQQRHYWKIMKWDVLVCKMFTKCKDTTLWCISHVLLQGTLAKLVCCQMKLFCAVKETEAEFLCRQYKAKKQKMVPQQQDCSGLIEM